jgi:GlcNAc-P-P-Und epimerase
MLHGRVLVTGGTGMLGRAVIPALAKAGYRVCVLVHQSPYDFWPASPLDIIWGDITDPACCQQAVSGNLDAVIHLAGRAHVRHNPTLLFKVNYQGTKNLADAAMAAGVRHFLFMSSQSVYGMTSEQPVREASQCCPVSTYGVSKLEAEKYLRVIANLGSMKYTILRPSVIYGENDSGNTMRMIRAIDQGWFLMVGSGRTRKSMTYVKNVVDVILRVILQPYARNEVFNVSDPEPYSLVQVRDTIAAALSRRPFRVSIPVGLAKFYARMVQQACLLYGHEPVMTPDDMKILTMDTTCDVSKLEVVGGYRSTILLDEGIRRTVAWYRAQRVP